MVSRVDKRGHEPAHKFTSSVNFVSSLGSVPSSLLPAKILRNTSLRHGIKRHGDSQGSKDRQLSDHARDYAGELVVVECPVTRQSHEQQTKQSLQVREARQLADFDSDRAVQAQDAQVAGHRVRQVWSSKQISHTLTSRFHRYMISSARQGMWRWQQTEDKRPCRCT